MQILSLIDPIQDFTKFRTIFPQKVPLNRGETQYQQYTTTSTAATTPLPTITNPIFGVDLSTHLESTQTQTPIVVDKCIEAIESIGINTAGLYRISGISSTIAQLKTQFDMNQLPDLTRTDIHNVTGLLKLYLRQLPNPLFTNELYNEFVSAQGFQGKSKVIKVHEVVNKLPDSHYATLRVLMKHLKKVVEMEHATKMGVSNLAIVFGPTAVCVKGFEGDYLIQSKIFEIVLENYNDIFE